MTVNELVADICGRLNLVSAEAKARVTAEINQHHRRITATIGLEPTRYISRAATTVLDSDKVTFTGIEKIDRVYERAPDGLVLVLQPVSLAALREGRESQGSRQQYAIWSQDADSITILLPGLALAITDLYADGWTTLAELAGTDEPSFPTSFHRILIDAVMSDEYLRKEKTQLADRYMAAADAGLRELRFHIADAPAIDLRQGDQVIPGASGGGTGGSGSSVITGDIVFDRDPGPPFTVTPGSGMVTNLDADKLDGQHGTFYQNGANLTDGSVSFAKLPNLLAGNLLGRGSAGGPGNPQPVTLGTGLSMSGTTLNATPIAPAAHATTHNTGGADPVTALSADILTSGTVSPNRIANGSLPLAKLVDRNPFVVVGRGNTTGPPQELQLGAGLHILGTVISAEGTVPSAHAPTHQATGGDVLDVTTLGGFPGGTSQFLRADGAFGTPAIVPAPGGSTTQVQFNDAGVLAGDAGLTYDKATGTIRINSEDGTNYGRLYADGNYFFIVSSGQLRLGAAGVDRWFIDFAGWGGGGLIPVADNASDVGIAGNRVRNIVAGTSVSVGDNPAQSGVLRLPNGAGGAIRFRNAANTNDVIAFTVDGYDNVLLGGSSVVFQTSLIPDRDAVCDLGYPGSNRLKDGYFSGTVTAGALSLPANAAIDSSTGDLDITAGKALADGADTAILLLRAAPDNGDGTRGARIVLGGNESALPGAVRLEGGIGPGDRIYVNQGITFPASQVVSPGTNTLDDYREGTWTPVIGGVQGESGQTYASQLGSYTKVGRLVSLAFDVTLSNKGTITQNTIIKGLPFVSDSTAPAYVCPILFFNVGGGPWTGMVGQLNATWDSIVIWASTPTGGASMSLVDGSAIANNTQFVGTLQYLAAN